MSRFLAMCRGTSAALLALAVSFPVQAVDAQVQAKYETKGYFDNEADFSSDADDPAIWVHPTDKSRSLVIASLKNGGAAVFNLKGVELQRILAPAGPTANDASGRYNNVDLLYKFSIGSKHHDLAVFSDRGRDKLEIYRIDPQYGTHTKPLTRVTASNVPYVFSRNQALVNEQRTAYGLATHNFGGASGAIGFVTQRERASIAKVQFAATANGSVTYSVIGNKRFPASFALPNGASWTPCSDEDGVEPQFEGLVIDEEAKELYAGQEPVGIWRMKLDFSAPALIEKVKTYGVSYTRHFDAEEDEYICNYTDDPGYGGKRLSADVEGLTIYYSPRDRGQRLLFASSQGDDIFHVWDIANKKAKGWQHAGSFQISYKGDLNQESDGSHIVSAALGRGEYSMGLFVSQDGDNTPEVLDEEGEVVDQTNFKFTPVKRILKALKLD